MKKKKQVAAEKIFKIEISTHSISDYGYYGKTGEFACNASLLAKPCKSCGELPVVKAEYDDTPGWRETTYVLMCNCFQTNLTSYMDGVLKTWNDRQSA